MSWCPGIPAATIGENIRRQHGLETRGFEQLHRVCYNILEAYSGLHQQGVLHGDVHPKNLLIDDELRVTILDFGLARFRGT